jgi:hypothetical protein
MASRDLRDFAEPSERNPDPLSCPAIIFCPAWRPQPKIRGHFVGDDRSSTVWGTRPADAEQILRQIIEFKEDRHLMFEMTAQG